MRIYEQEQKFVNQSPERMRFQEIVRTYGGYVYTIAWRMLGNAADAEDAAQETFIKVFKNVSNYDKSYVMKNWICTIALNTARDMYRKTKHNRATQSKTEVDRIPASSEAAKEVQHRIDVNKMLSCLDIKYRSVVILFYMERYSIKEICTIMKKRENVIKVWLYRARKILMKEYGDTVL